jgi:NH3-dependent NAD+ synthetase
MRRNFLSSVFVAALLPAASLWAAPNAAATSNSYLSQITEQTHQIQAQADRLESYTRSGAHDSVYAAALAWDMAESAQKLAAILDQFVSQPGTTNDIRQQVERMKVSVAELEAFIGSASQNVDRNMTLHTREVLSSVLNIMDRGNSVRAAAQTLAAGSN